SLTRGKMKADLAVAMGGRVAEELIFGHEKVTSGASADISMATNLSRAMVTQFGMSEALGPLSYSANEEEVFLGHSVARTQNVSDETQLLVDSETRRFVEEGYATAKKIITKHRKQLEIIAQGLLEFETLSGDEIKALLEGTRPHRETTGDEPQAPSSAVPKTGKGAKKDDSPDDASGLEPQPQT
ncbi:MAG: cell division protein FtsH, partial [Fimbriimonadaceae bacterium]|nr:cell division protein FtsH [Alphaproteobacteria bacterium]